MELKVMMSRADLWIYILIASENHKRFYQRAPFLSHQNSLLFTYVASGVM